MVKSVRVVTRTDDGECERWQAGKLGEGGHWRGREVEMIGTRI